MSKNQSNNILTRVKDLLETVRVYINADGGDIEFVSLESKVLTLKILGACVGCPFIGATFDEGVKTLFLSEFKDELKDVVFVSNHPTDNKPIF